MVIEEMTHEQESGMDTARRASEAVTAVISILTTASGSNLFDREYIPYSLHLTLLGATVLPPYLPRKATRGLGTSHESILSAIKDLDVFCRGRIKDNRLDRKVDKELLKRIRDIGGLIAEYLHEFVKILQSVKRLDIVRNIIIHTDDFSIPWQWVHYLEDEDDEEGDFLMNRFPCGTLIVDKSEYALENFRSFVEARERTPTTDMELDERSFCLLQGLLGKSDEARRQSRAYGRHFRDIFLDRFPEKKVILKDDSEWSQHPTTRALVAKLSEFTDNASILHYSGHIRENTLVFNEEHDVTPKDLRKLGFLEKRPLVVLHGCSSGKIQDAQQKTEQLATVLLSRGASGCIVSLLPVDHPMRLEESHNSMIDLFYSNVVGKMMPYGQALFEAQREFQADPATSDNPQWLFFQLYGDPRGMLVDSSTSTVLSKLKIAADREDRVHAVVARAKGKIEIFGDDFPLTAWELEEALQKSGVAEFEIGVPTGTLGVELLEMMVDALPDLLLVGKWVALTAGGAVIEKIVEQMLKSAGLKQVTKAERPQRGVIKIVIKDENEKETIVECVREGTPA